MAKPVGFQGANIVYEALPGRDDIGDLECFKDDRQVISCWRLDEDEIKTINKTGVVWLSIQGHTVAPVFVSGTALVKIGDQPSKAEPILPKKARKP